MATAADLMRNAIAQSSPEDHIVIGSDKFITVPESLKRIAVQFEHNAETVTFDCPRYWDDKRVDLKTLVICINYTLPDGTPDCYPSKTTVDENNSNIIHFDWKISENLTKLKGAIQFSVCGVSTSTVDGEEKLEVRWNSEINRDMYVSEGMECPASQIIEEYEPDLVIQLLERYMSVDEINASVEMSALSALDAQTAMSTAHNILNEIQNKEDHIRNSYAPAIKGNASGEIIRVDDVSSLEHDVELRVHSKNRLSLTGTPSQEFAQSHTYRSWFVNPDRKTMTLSATEKGDNPDISGIYFGFCENGRDGLDGIKWLIENGSIIQDHSVYSNLPYISIYPATQDTITTLDAWFDIQLEVGSVPTSYEPWVDPAMVTVTCSNKNMFSYPFDGTNYGNGIKFTDAGDGSLIVHGTNDGVSNSVFYITKDSYLTIPAGTYSCSPNVAGLLLMGVEKGGGYFTLASENKTSFTLSEPKTFRSIYLQIGKGNTTSFHNKKVRVMLEYGSDLSKFESPASTTHNPSSDGTCIITSKSPTMTLFTDTPGVTIEAEYNRDTTKMFESYVLTDNAKSEIADLVAGEMADVLASLNDYATSLIGGGD